MEEGPPVWQALWGLIGGKEGEESERTTDSAFSMDRSVKGVDEALEDLKRKQESSKQLVDLLKASRQKSPAGTKMTQLFQREIEVLAGEAKELERKLGMEREERERLEGVVRDRERRLNELQSSVEAERSSNSLLARGIGGGVSLEESLRERLMAEERERERAEQELRTLRREREAEAGSPVPKMGLLTEATSAVVRGSPVKEGGSDPEGLRNLVAQWEVRTREAEQKAEEATRRAEFAEASLIQSQANSQSPAWGGGIAPYEATVALDDAESTPFRMGGGGDTFGSPPGPGRKGGGQSSMEGSALVEQLRARLSQRERDLAEATGRARKSEAEAHSLRQHAKRLSEEAQAARRERDEENSRGEERRVELLALREECQSLGEECERAKGELADAVRMRDAELASVRREAANDRRRLAIAEAGLSERDAEIASLQEEAGERLRMSRSLAIAESTARENRAEIAEMTRLRDEAERCTDALRGELSERDANIRKLRAEVERLEGEAEKECRRARAAKRRQDEMEGKSGEVQSRFKDLDASLREAEEKLGERDAKLFEASTQCKHATAKASDLELRLERETVARNSIEARCGDVTAQLERVRGELRDALSREVDGEAAVRQTLEEMENEVMSSRRQVKEARESERVKGRCMSSLAQQLVDAAVYASVDDAIASATPGGISQRAVDGPGDSGAGSRVTEQALEWCRKEAESARGECEEERRARIIAEADLLDAKRRIEELKGRLALAERSCTEVTIEQAELQGSLFRSEADVRSLEGRVRKRDSLIASLTEGGEVLRKSIEDSEAKRKELLTRVREGEGEVRERETQVAALSRSLQAIEVELGEMSGAPSVDDEVLRRIVGVLGEWRVESQSRKRKESMLVEEASKLRARTSELEDEVMRLEREKKAGAQQMRARIGELEDEVMRLEGEKKAGAQQMRARIGELEEEVMRLEKESGKVVGLGKEKEEEILGLRARVGELESRAEALQLRGGVSEIGSFGVTKAATADGSGASDVTHAVSNPGGGGGGGTGQIARDSSAQGATSVEGAGVFPSSDRAAAGENAPQISDPGGAGEGAVTGGGVTLSGTVDLETVKKLDKALAEAKVRAMGMDEEALSLRGRITDLEASLKEKEDEAQDLQGQKQDAVKERDAAVKDKEDAVKERDAAVKDKEDLAKVDEELQANEGSRAELKKLKVDYDQALSDIAYVREERNGLRGDLFQAREKRDRAMKEKDSCMVELRRIKEEMEAIKQNIKEVSDGDQDSKIELESVMESKGVLEVKIASMVEERDAAVKEKQDAVKERDAAVKDKEDAVKERDAAVKDKEDAVKERDAAVKDKEDAVKERDAAVKDKERDEGNAESVAKIDVLRGERDAASAKIDVLRGERDAASAKIDVICSERDAALGDTARLRAEGAMLRRELEERRGELEDKRQACQQLRIELERREKDEEARSRAGGGAETLLQASRHDIARLEDEIAARIQTEEKLRGAIALGEFESGTCKADVAEAMRGREEAEKQVIVLRRELEEAREDVANIRDQGSQAAAIAAALSARNATVAASLNSDLALADERMRRAEGDAEQARAELREVKKELIQVLTDLGLAKEDLERGSEGAFARITDDLAKANSERDAALMELEAKSKELSGARRDLAYTEGELERLRNGRDGSAGRQQLSVAIDGPRDAGAHDERQQQQQQHHHHVPRGDVAQDSLENEGRLGGGNSASAPSFTGGPGSIGDHLISIGDRLSTLRNDVSGPGSQT